MAKDKSIVITARTHEIFRREVITKNSENFGKGKEDELNLKTMLGEVAEIVQAGRNYTDLPGVTK